MVMGERDKVCLDCGTTVDASEKYCPVCHGTRFRMSEDDGTTILRFSSSHSEPAPPEKHEKKPASHSRGKKQPAPVKKEIRLLAEKYDRLPVLTKKLTMILAAVAVLLAIVLAAAALNFKGNGNEAVSSSPSAVPSATPESADATPAPDGSAIGRAVIVEDLINVRTEPDTSAPILGVVETGTEHDVFEVRESGGYTWYRIGDQQWIADSGGWITYTEN